MEFGGGKTQATELVEMSDMDEIEDNKSHRWSAPISPIWAKREAACRLGIYVQVAGRKMQPDFEPILERQIHHLINYAQGIMHIGQRDIAWIRLGRPAVDKGFKISHIGQILHDMFHKDFSSILDKVQVTLYTETGRCGQDHRKGARHVQKTATLAWRT